MLVDSSQSGNMVSICGEDMAPGTTFVRESGSGFISSPLYPSNYPPDCNCFCRLEVTSSTPQTAQIVLYVLDLELSRTPEEELGNSICSSLASGCLNSDWLQYGSAGQSPGTGRNLSMDEKGKPVYTGSNVVLISFHSDSLMEDRGFWIKYVGKFYAILFSVNVLRSNTYPSPATGLTSKLSEGSVFLDDAKLQEEEEKANRPVKRYIIKDAVSNVHGLYFE